MTSDPDSKGTRSNFAPVAFSMSVKVMLSSPVAPEIATTVRSFFAFSTRSEQVLSGESALATMSV